MSGVQRSVLSIHGAQAIVEHPDSFLRPLDAQEQVLQPSDAVNSNPGQQTSVVAGCTSASRLPRNAEISAPTVIVMAAPMTATICVDMA
jgi:hypothetical protein